MKKIFLLAIVGYQKIFSPIVGAQCCFYPSCSEYAKRVIEKYSLIQAIGLIVRRLMRCHPRSVAGVDLP